MDYVLITYKTGKTEVINKVFFESVLYHKRKLIKTYRYINTPSLSKTLLTYM